MTAPTSILTEIFVYPIKSCAAVPVQTAQLTELGLQTDRRWVIVDQTGMFQTQRQIPHLVWIEPELTDQSMTLRAPSQPAITIDLADEISHTRKVTVWRDTVSALDMGDAAAQWLDAFLQVPGKQFRLVQFDPRHPRICDETWTGSGERQSRHPFTDGFGLNILSRRSLDDLNQRLEQAGLEAVSALHFRPNLVIDGVPAHEEDSMSTIRLDRPGGQILLEMVKPCTRCQIPEINPYTAIREPRITDVLAHYRRLERMDHAICFGMNAVVREGNGLLLEPGPFVYDLDF
ncbi:MOSC domain-containing protein [Orrella marina]|uniref:MOSC domain-containing protein n=1 Tax=Orrella marina TaxID=2163011 RepID=UPI001D130C52|nr:MOSC N-terminal beta barrel domain-containing protein [Orrella marina]